MFGVIKNIPKIASLKNKNYKKNKQLIKQL